jgi:hypothetical protein
MPKNTVKYGRNELGKFAKGNVGKPLGATNKTTKEARETITAFINDKITDLDRIYEGLEDKDKATLLLHLVKLVMPKPTIESERINEPMPPIIISFTDKCEDKD